MSSENLKIEENTVKITGTTEGYPYIVSPHTITTITTNQKVLHRGNYIVIKDDSVIITIEPEP